MQNLLAVAQKDWACERAPVVQAARGRKRQLTGHVGALGYDADSCAGGGIRIAQAKVIVAGLRDIDRVLEPFAVGGRYDGIAAAGVGGGGDIDIVAERYWPPWLPGVVSL